MTESIIKVVITTAIISITCLIAFIIAVFKFKDVKLNFGKAKVDLSKGKNNYEYIARCMNYAENKIDQMIGDMQDIYRIEVLRITDDATKQEEYTNFCNFLVRVKMQISDKVKLSIKDANYNGIENIWNDIQGIFDVYYTGRFISRKEMDSVLLDKCHEDIYDKLKDVFAKAKELIDAK